MTFFARVSARWRAATVAAERPLAVMTAARPKRHLPAAEYMPLYSYLENRHATMVFLTFEQIESLLGFALPAPARTERSWWTGENQTVVARHADTWAMARRTAAPNLPAQTVAFERQP